MSTAADIRRLLDQRLAPTHLELEDEGASHAGHQAAGQGHFRLRIVSTSFSGLRPLERHRLVNETLTSLFSRGIHALAMETLTPDEYFKQST